MINDKDESLLTEMSDMIFERTQLVRADSEELAYDLLKLVKFRG